MLGGGGGGVGGDGDLVLMAGPLLLLGCHALFLCPEVGLLGGLEGVGGAQLTDELPPPLLTTKHLQQHNRERERERERGM